MYQFWEHLTLPLLDTEKPKVVVEIGSKDGLNTRFLYQYCSEHNAVLHTIDPEPTFDVSDIQKGRDDVLHMYKDLSLNALPLIHNIDAVLIDGDHNWYTVYNELRILADQAKQDRASFPMVLLHDVCWPYARRDLYYDPATIPEDFRHKYAQKGLIPGKKDALDYGLNSNMYNAIHEGGPKNGVLTAVEDFMMETDEPMHFHSVPAFHGYGILVSEQRLAICPGLRISFSDLLPPQNLRCLIASLEQSRVKATAADLAQKSQALVKASEQAKQKSFLDRENTQLKQVITLRDRALAETKTAISELSKEKSSLERSNAKLNQTVAQRDIALTKKDAAIAEKDRAIRRYRDELYSVYTSRSWRVTAPMRKIGTFVRRVTSLAHRPRIRGMIKQVYFLLPGFMRNSHRVQSLKNRFKSKEL